jgi:hypothetical protein
MDTIERVKEFYHLGRLPRHSPIEIPNTGREQLAELFAALDFKRGAEIGVYRGEYSEIICKANPKVKLYAIDSWINYGDFALRGMGQAKDQAQTRLKDFDVDCLHMDSIAASQMFVDGALDFVYIDGNHDFLHVAQDLFYWTRKVRPGGIVAGHDYFQLKKPESNMHCPPVLHAFTEVYKIHPWFILGTKAIIPGEIRERHRSWFWVRE